jgi:hypothetical protein
MICSKAPKGWKCGRDKDHAGACEVRPVNVPLHFLRRNPEGKLERLVSNGQWTGWISAERPSRYWYVWASLAKARGI